MDLSVVIVNYNTKKLTQDCINSIIATTKYTNYEIIVVDNSEKAGHRFEVRESQKDKIKVIYGVENRGFGNACNIGVKQSLGKYILLINSDMIAHDNTIDKSIDYIKKDDKIGILGVRVILKDGTFEHGAKRGFPTPAASFYYFTGLDKKYPDSKKYGAYRQTFINENETSKVDAVSGSFMIISKCLYDEIDGFDEDFFMYGEDLDICYRVHEKGKKVIYFADVYATHLRGQSGLSYNSPKILYHFYNAMKIFYKKHYEKKYNIFINTVVYAAINLKYSLAKMKSRK